MPLMVRFISPGVVVGRAEAPRTDASDRSPGDLSEIDEEIRGELRDLLGTAPGQVALRAQSVAERIPDRCDLFYRSHHAVRELAMPHPS